MTALQAWSGACVEPLPPLDAELDAEFIAVAHLDVAPRRRVFKHLAFAEWARADNDPADVKDYLRKALRILVAAEMPHVAAVAFVARALVDARSEGDPREWITAAYEALARDGDGDPSLAETIQKMIY